MPIRFVLLLQQEPGDDRTIKEFISDTFGVTFPVRRQLASSQASPHAAEHVREACVPGEAGKQPARACVAEPRSCFAE